MLPSCYTSFHNQCPRTMTGEDNRDAQKAIPHFHTKFAGLSSLESCRLILTCLWLGTPNQGSTFCKILMSHIICIISARDPAGRSLLLILDQYPRWPWNYVDQDWIWRTIPLRLSTRYDSHCCWPPPQRRVILSPPWLKSCPHSNDK